MSIYESLRTGMNDFGHGDRFEGYPRMPVLNADQPAQIVGLTSPNKRPHIEALNLAPPFSRFFIECALPPELRFRLTSYVGDTGEFVVAEALEIGFDVTVEKDDCQNDKGAPERAKWLLRCQPYYKTDADPSEADPLVKSDFRITIGLRDDGFPLTLPKETPETLDAVFRSRCAAFWIGQDGELYSVMACHAIGDTPAWKRLVEEGEQAVQVAVAASPGSKADANLSVLYHQTVEQFVNHLPLLYAINSLHNKRTVLATAQHSRQVRRAAQRNGQQPPDQKTIVVKDFVTIMQGARKAQAEGNSHPLGETIGHWRRYGVDGRTGLLFGKYRGTFFVPSFLRGNPEKGATDHDYVLKVGAAA